MRLLRMPLPPRSCAELLGESIRSGGGNEDGAPTSLGSERAVLDSQIAWLDPFVHRDQRWCAKCEERETFIFVFASMGGRWGYFLSCGRVEFVADERTVA